MLIAQLLEEEGCYSMISCYPTQMNRSPQRGELVIGRVLFQFIPSSGESQIQASKTPSETTTSSVSTSGQVSADNMPQIPASVNIYDVRIKDKDGEFFRQQYDPTVHFSAIGPNAKTWDKYPDSRKFKGRDDGKMRVEIDASQFRYIPMNKRASTVSAERFADKVEAAMVDAAEAAFAVRDRGLKAMNDTFDNVLDSHVPEVYSTKGIIQEYLIGADSFDRAEVARLIHQHKPYDIKADLSRTWMLEDVLKADELYEAYPQLRSVLV